MTHENRGGDLGGMGDGWAGGARAAGETIYMEGKITAAFAWQPLFLNTNGGPLAYRGIFSHDAESGQASFVIEASPELVGSPYDLLLGKVYDGAVENTPEQVQANLVSLPVAETWMTSFDLSLDKAAGSGTWYWQEGPPEVCTPTGCAPSLPPSTASATVTAFRVVPEPGRS